MSNPEGPATFAPPSVLRASSFGLLSSFVISSFGILSSLVIPSFDISTETTTSPRSVNMMALPTRLMTS
jgi:hypothetical protein